MFMKNNHSLLFSFTILIFLSISHIFCENTFLNNETLTEEKYLDPYEKGYKSYYKGKEMLPFLDSDEYIVNQVFKGYWNST